MNFPCAPPPRRRGRGGERVESEVKTGKGSGGSACFGDTGRAMSEPAPPVAELTLRRRLPPRLPRRRGDVYVNMKTDFKAQLSRCQKLLGPGGGCTEICIHGLGLAINRAINIALQLQTGGAGALRLAANTSTVELADVLEAQSDEDGHPPLARARNNSAIHIRVCRVSPPP